MSVSVNGTSSGRQTQQVIRLRIPQSFHQEPVISQLVSRFHVTVNITAALLGGNAQGDGWFALELRGSEAAVQGAIAYLNDLNLEVWDAAETDGW
jgi:ABC-type methionine transport system ATPase subunit